MYNGLIGSKTEGIAPCLLMDVGTMATVEQGCPRVTEVAHVIAFAQHQAELCGVRGDFRVLMSISVGDAIANASYADGVLSLHCADAKAEQQ